MTVSLTTNNQNYALASGQTVTSAGSIDVVRNAIRVDAQNVVLTIAGTVSGGGDTGILLDTGPRINNPDPFAGASVVYYFFDNSSMAVTVAAGGVVSGYYGIQARVHPLNLADAGFGGVIEGGGTARATVDNSGSILATGGGYALYSWLYQNQPFPGSAFAQVTNRAGGVIGAIEATIENLNNAGTINGGGRAAIKNLGTSIIENSGLITASTTAIQGEGALRITNAATGVITGGSAAISASFNGLELVNAGTINGNIFVPTRFGAFGSVLGGNFIENSRGTINGNVTFYASDDLFVGRLGNAFVPLGQAVGARIDSQSLVLTGTINSSVYSGVTGTLDGGAGIDTLALVVSGMVTTTMPVLPTNFERLRFELNDAASLTITSGASAGIVLSGRGSFTSAATITGNTTALSFGPRLANAIETGPPIALKNTGVLSSSFDPGSEGNAVAAVFFKSSDLFEISPVLSRFENTGSITAANARAVIVSIGGRPDAVFDNSGTITSTTARAIEVVMVGTVSNQFTNSGTINGTTLIDFRPGAPGATSAGSNSGRMEAVGEALRMSGGNFANAGGQIVSTGAGTNYTGAVTFFSLADSNLFENSGAITSNGIGVYLYNSRVLNTGSIISAQKPALVIDSGGQVENAYNGVLRGGAGVAIQSNARATIYNAGLIDGEVDLSGNNSGIGSLVDNSGVINGSLKFGSGNDTYIGAYGIQGDVRGGWGNDSLTGGSGNDLFYGDQGNDMLDGGAGNDVLIGGTGNDIYIVDNQADVIIEQANEGRDEVSSLGSFYLYANVEVLTLDGAGDHFGVGNALANTITGNGGSNLLLGGGGNDTIYGGAGVDSLFGEAGNDILYGEDGIDYLVGGAGNDQLFGGAAADALYGEDGDDVLDGGVTFSTDILVGGAGNDTLNGASGQGDYDLMDGGAGDDVFQVDTPDDLTFEAADGGTDTVRANINGAGFYLYANTENLVLEGNTPFGVGNELDNQLTGNTIANYLLGGLGNDRLNGKAGNDVLFGEGGADIFVFERGTGGDVIGDFEAGTDKISLAGLGFANYAALQPNIFQVGGNTGINLGQGDFIVLNGVSNAQLSATDFIFG